MLYTPSNDRVGRFTVSAHDCDGWNRVFRFRCSVFVALAFAIDALVLS